MRSIQGRPHLRGFQFDAVASLVFWLGIHGHLSSYTDNHVMDRQSLQGNSHSRLKVTAHCEGINYQKP